MDMQNESEKRRSPRQRRSDAIFWRMLGQSEYDMGWILESSADGLAFAWRGDSVPPRGSIVEVHRGRGSGGEGNGDDLTTKPERALVRRSRIAHEDLAVIAVQIIPDAEEITKAVSEVAIKPRLRRRHAPSLV